MPIEPVVEELSDEELKVQNWRIEKFLEMGLDMSAAIEMAASDMDLAEIRKLIKDQGCEPSLAVKILA